VSRSASWGAGNAKGALGGSIDGDPNLRPGEAQSETTTSPDAGRAAGTVPVMSPTWIWLQAAIVVFVLAGIVIATIKLV